MPEQSARLDSIQQTLDGSDFTKLVRREASRVTREDLERAHRSAYIDKVMSLIPDAGFWALDDDTIVSPQSGEAALYAAGCVVDAVDAVMTGAATNAFCAVRPPGHHAGIESSAGFCIFNNVAVGALVAQARYAVKRVAIVDIDVHHGNGTQEIVWNNPDIFFASLHQQSLFPLDSGMANENGAFNNVLNVPLPAHTDSLSYRRHLSELVLPRLEAFQPDLLLVSAGFDGHHEDPLGGFDLKSDDYTWISSVLLDVAHRLCQDRFIAVLEGGYDLNALAASAAAFMKSMMEVEQG